MVSIRLTRGILKTVFVLYFGCIINREKFDNSLEHYTRGCEQGLMAWPINIYYFIWKEGIPTETSGATQIYIIRKQTLLSSSSLFSIENI